MAHHDVEHDIAEARRRLVEAEATHQRARSEVDISRDIRDSAMVAAHRAGISSSEISQLVGDMGQPNVVRARRRAVTRRDVIPDGLLSPAEALRLSNLAAAEFIERVRDRRLRPVDLPGGVRAFRAEDIERLRSGA